PMLVRMDRTLRVEDNGFLPEKENVIHALLRAAHAWSGAVLSLLLLVVSLTGTALIWKDDYLRWRLPAARAEFTPEPAALAQVARQVEARYDANDLMSFYFPTERLGIARVAVYPET